MRREDLLEIVIWADLEADVGTLDVSFFLERLETSRGFLECFLLVGRHVFFCLMWLEVAKILGTKWANDRLQFNFAKGVLLDM